MLVNEALEMYMAPCKAIHVHTRDCEILVWQLAVVDSITFAGYIQLLFHKSELLLYSLCRNLYM